MARSSPSPTLHPRAAGTPAAPARSTAALLFVSVRPEQWTKNLVVFAAALFGGRLFDPAALGLALATFFIFCALSGAVYLFNDIADREADQRHPLKRSRPIASGALAPTSAAALAIALGLGGTAAALWIAPALGGVAGLYLALLLGYSALLKNLVIIDALTIAAGFVLRAVAGTIAVAVPFSSWLLVCTTLLALFLAFSKRRHELTLLADGAADHRRILHEYSPYLLDQMIAVVTASTLIAYSVYATSTETAERLETNRLGLTIPFVLYGIFRYLYLVHQKRGGGSPAAMLVTDGPLLVCVALWAAMVAVILYTPLGR
jgi:4-hydroxybenzoate polyprenyltransferase